jgi:segregation and condensation protein B
MAEHDDDSPEQGGPEADDEGSAPQAEGGGLGPGDADFGDDDDEDIGLGAEGPGLAGAAQLREEDVKGALEALILVSDKPIPAMRLARLTRQDVGHVRRVLAEIVAEFKPRGIVLDEIAGGYQFRTSARFAPFVRMLLNQKPTRLTRAQLEVLAIVAYRQPVTRPEIDDVRGVDSGSAIKVLLERNVIKIVGKKEDAGRPMLYGTTSEFLELFGLNTLRDLPTLREFAELSAESRDMFERRIGAPLPGQGQGMDLSTHYEAPPDLGEAEGEGQADPEAEPGPESAEPASPAQIAQRSDAEDLEADYEAPEGEEPRG